MAFGVHLRPASAPLPTREVGGAEGLPKTTASRVPTMGPTGPLPAAEPKPFAHRVLSLLGAGRLAGAVAGALLLTGCALNQGAPLDFREGLPASPQTNIDLAFDLTGTSSDPAIADKIETQVSQVAQQITKRFTDGLAGAPLETLDRLRKLTPDHLADLTRGAVSETSRSLGIDITRLDETSRDTTTMLTYDGTGAPVRGAEVDGSVPTLTAQLLLTTLPAELIETLDGLLAQDGGMRGVFDEAADRLSYRQIDAAHVIAVAKVLHPARSKAIDTAVAAWIDR